MEACHRLSDVIGNAFQPLFQTTYVRKIVATHTYPISIRKPRTTDMLEDKLQLLLYPATEMPPLFAIVVVVQFFGRRGRRAVVSGGYSSWFLFTRGVSEERRTSRGDPRRPNRPKTRFYCIGGEKHCYHPKLLLCC